MYIYIYTSPTPPLSTGLSLSNPLRLLSAGVHGLGNELLFVIFLLLGKVLISPFSNHLVVVFFFPPLLLLLFRAVCAVWDWTWICFHSFKVQFIPITIRDNFFVFHLMSCMSERCDEVQPRMTCRPLDESKINKNCVLHLWPASYRWLHFYFLPFSC